jgi:MFS family permease
MQLPDSIESRASWTAALAALCVLAVTCGAPLAMVVALKSVATDLDVPRAVPAFASSLAWLGAGLGGIPMGWLVERIGMRRVAAIGATSVTIGMLLSASGGIVTLYIGHGLFIGLLGNACFLAPLMTYVTRWFDRRRGTALALITSGQYVAGVVWPSIFERILAAYDWRTAMRVFAVAEIAVVLPIALLFLARPPRAPEAGSYGAGPMPGGRVLGWRPNTVLALLSAGIFLCCIPMALPSAHLVAFCTDLGITRAHGAAMLSVLLGSAFISRQFWGWVADRIGGLRTILAGSACQAVALSLFLVTQDEVGLFAIASAFGFGFAGIIPAYVLTVRELFPASEASWRVPAMMFPGLLGMASGAWLGGLLYDHTGSYATAFLTGVAFNLVNLAVIATLVLRSRPRMTLAAA